MAAHIANQSRTVEPSIFQGIAEQIKTEEQGWWWIHYSRTRHTLNNEELKDSAASDLLKVKGGEVHGQRGGAAY